MIRRVVGVAGDQARRTSSIIAIKGKDFIVRNFDHVPTLTKEMLLARDRYLCAYCAQWCRFGQLDMEHIVPSSKGGGNSWMNLVTACKACNNRELSSDDGRKWADRGVGPIASASLIAYYSIRYACFAISEIDLSLLRPKHIFPIFRNIR